MIHFDYWCDPAKKGPGWVHFLRAKESYATFAVSERAAMPDISVMALVAKGLKGEGWKEPTRYAHVKTHWTGFHYIQGGHCWSHKDWVFNEDVAAALDRGETVELVDIPVEQMRGWYRCTLCDLVVHDPECPSCSKSCPVCEIVEADDDSVVFSRVVDAPIRGHTVTHAFIDDANFTDPEMDDVTIAGDMEVIARKHGMCDEDIRAIRERFLKSYPQLKALAQQLKEKK